MILHLTNKFLLYRSLSIKKLSKLFDNAQISLELLQRFGFFAENGRLVISERQPSHLCSAIKYLTNSDNTHSTLQQIALNTLEMIQNTILSELMDEIPDDIMDNIANEIYNCTQQNDFEKLLQLLYKTVIKYRRKNVEMYFAPKYHLSLTYVNNLQLCSHKKNVFAEFWEDFEDNVKNRRDKTNIAKWLYNNQFPQAICDHMLHLIDHLDLNLTVTDDSRLFIELVCDRRLCIALKQYVYEFSIRLYSLILPYSKKIRNANRFTQNYLQFWMKLSHQYDFDDFTDLDFYLLQAQAQVKTFVEKWINYHDESYLSKRCKVILDVNKWHEWKCYQCNMINAKHELECKGCRQGINPLYLAKYNKSQTFCVEKPFGLIKHFSKQVCMMCVCVSFVNRYKQISNRKYDQLQIDLSVSILFYSCFSFSFSTLSQL